MVLYPCGHFMLCRWCAQMVSDCPVLSFGHHRRDPDLQGANLPELSDAMCLAAIVLFGSFWYVLS